MFLAEQARYGVSVGDLVVQQSVCSEGDGYEEVERDLLLSQRLTNPVGIFQVPQSHITPSLSSLIQRSLRHYCFFSAPFFLPSVLLCGT